MTLEGKRIAIQAGDNYQELEPWYPLLRIREAGLPVVLSPERDFVESTSERGS